LKKKIQAKGNNIYKKKQGKKGGEFREHGLTKKDGGD